MIFSHWFCDMNNIFKIDFWHADTCTHPHADTHTHMHARIYHEHRLLHWYIYIYVCIQYICVPYTVPLYEAPFGPFCVEPTQPNQASTLGFKFSRWPELPRNIGSALSFSCFVVSGLKAVKLKWGELNDKWWPAEWQQHKPIRTSEVPLSLCSSIITCTLCPMLSMQEAPWDFGISCEFMWFWELGDLDQQNHWQTDAKSVSTCLYSTVVFSWPFQNWFQEVIILTWNAPNGWDQLGKGTALCNLFRHTKSQWNNRFCGNIMRNKCQPCSSNYTITLTEEAIVTKSVARCCVLKYNTCPWIIKTVHLRLAFLIDVSFPCQNLSILVQKSSEIIFTFWRISS